MLKRHPHTTARPLVAEIIGPPGSGKSTLLAALREQRPGVRSVAQMRSLGYLPALLSSAARQLPALARQRSWWQVRQLVRLAAMQRAFSQPAPGAVTIVDQGPVYTLARMHGAGMAAEGSLYRQWAATLDLVIWLDAPDALLVERIDRRSKPHAVKGRPEHEAGAYLAGLRASFAYVVAQLQAQSGPRVLRFDTSQAGLDQIADQVLGACVAHEQGS